MKQTKTTLWIFVLIGVPILSYAGGISPVLTASRNSGVAPLSVYFDASQSNGLSNDDVLGAFFSWDFGDPNGGLWAPTGNSKNLATGFIAAHVFETPGVYTVTVDIQDTAGQIAGTTIAITVLDPELIYQSSSRCVSQAGNFVGAPAGCELVTSSNFSTQINWLNGAGSRRLLLRTGETWQGNLELTSDGPCTLGAFGAGNQPIIQTENQNEVISGVRMAGDDCRLMDIEIDGSQASGDAITGGDSDGNHNLALRINSHNTNFVGWGLGGDNAFLVDSRVENNDYFSMYTDGVNVAIMGSYIDQIRVATSFSRPLESKNVFITDNRIDASRPQPSTGIKWHGRRGVITANQIVAGNSRIALSNSDGVPTGFDVDVNLGFLLIERNRMENSGDITNDQYNSNGISFALNTDVMVRNNLIIDANRAFGGGEGFIENVRILHNTVLMTNEVQGLNISNGDFMGFYQDLVNFEVSNNIIAILATINGSAYPEQGIFIQLENSNGITLSNNLVYKPDHPINNKIGNQFYDFNQWMTLGLEQGSIEADPAFITVSPGSPLFLQLSPSSPAIDMAVEMGLSEDYLRAGRPQDGDNINGAEPDVGAFEFDPTPVVDLIFADGFDQL